MQDPFILVPCSTRIVDSCTIVDWERPLIKSTYSALLQTLSSFQPSLVVFICRFVLVLDPFSTRNSCEAIPLQSTIMDWTSRGFPVTSWSGQSERNKSSKQYQSSLSLNKILKVIRTRPARSTPIHYNGLLEYLEENSTNSNETLHIQRTHSVLSHTPKTGTCHYYCACFSTRTL